jgi:hypothetical protein
MNMRLADFGRIARVDGAIFPAFRPNFLGGVIGEDHVLGLDTGGFKKRPADRAGGIQVEHSRDADPHVLAPDPVRFRGPLALEVLRGVDLRVRLGEMLFPRGRAARARPR